MDYYAMTNFAILKEIGGRIKSRRLERNLTQQYVADTIGISRLTIKNIEDGKPVSMLHFIEVLRSLGALESIDELLPSELPSPILLLKQQKKMKRRATKQIEFD